MSKEVKSLQEQRWDYFRTIQDELAQLDRALMQASTPEEMLEIQKQIDKICLGLNPKVTPEK